MTTFLFKGIDIGEVGTPVKASKREETGRKEEERLEILENVIAKRV